MEETKIKLTKGEIAKIAANFAVHCAVPSPTRRALGLFRFVTSVTI